MADKSVWLNVEDEDAWVLCTVEGSTDSEVNLLRAHAPDGVSTKTTITMEAYKKLTPVTGDMSVPVHDLCLLEDVNTASLLHTLRQRYAVDDIYTAIGPIVVAVNPYKKVASCSAENFANMKDLDEESIPPHVFRVGLSAYMAMMRTGSAQSVLISGESGAGKTETAKLTMNVLAEVSQSSGKTTEQCLEAGIVLEAFGNAKTVYNNNSSRFGKWCAVHFQKGQIATCKIRSYLLEKTRVVTVNEGERNYHVFYHMLAGCTAEEKSTYLLAGTNDAYNYTKGQATSPGIDDVEEWEQVHTPSARERCSRHATPQISHAPHPPSTGPRQARGARLLSRAAGRHVQALRRRPHVGQRRVCREGRGVGDLKHGGDQEGGDAAGRRLGAAGGEARDAHRLRTRVVVHGAA